MHISEPARPRRQTSLVPLVDITFLLVMFFMLSSTFGKFADLDVERQGEASKAEPAAAGPTGPLAGVVITVSGAGEVEVNGRRVARDELVAALDALHAKGARTAIVLTGKDATVQDLVSALELARTSRIGSIAIAR